MSTTENLEKTPDKLRQEKIQDLIRNSDYPGLAKYVEQLESIQENLIHFDDPSLVLLAVELYLDPGHLTNPKYQFEIIVFLLKCGLSLFVPKGTVVLYLMNKAQDWGVSDDKLYEVLKTLISWGKTEILLPDLPDFHQYYEYYYEGCYDYLLTNQAAMKIQRFWRGKRVSAKKLRSRPALQRETIVLPSLNHPKFIFEFINDNLY